MVPYTCLQAYNAAIQRAVARRKATDGEVHVLDMGTGAGLLSLMVARAGADSVVACDLHESLAAVARKAVARNGCSDKVSVVHRDIGLLERGKEVRRLGFNLAVADFFDSGKCPRCQALSVNASCEVEHVHPGTCLQRP